MVHYQPSAQVPARRGGRTAGPTPAAGASPSAGRARARGRPAAFVGPSPRRARPGSDAEGAALLPPLLMGPTWRQKGRARRGQVRSLRTPQRVLARGVPSARPQGSRAPASGGATGHSPEAVKAGGALLARGKQKSSLRRLCKAGFGHR